MAASAYGIVALAASAGGLNALTHVLSTLPASFPLPLVIVQHLSPRHPSLMASILSRRTALSVRDARSGEPLEPGVAYLAPRDRHLLVNPDFTLFLASTQLVHFVRPSADLLFESVAATFRERAIAVVLSGTGSDGATGVKAIKQMGGMVIVQDDDSEFSGMPLAARAAVAADLVLPLDDITAALVSATLAAA